MAKFTETIREDLLNIFQRGQRVKNHKSCIKEFIKYYKKWHDSQEFIDYFYKLIKTVLVCDRSNPYTKRGLDFITLIFKEMIEFEEEKENQRMEDEARNVNESTDSMEEDMDELGKDAFDQTIIDERFLPHPTRVDIIINELLVPYLECENVNVRANSTLLLKKMLDCFEEMDETTFKVLVEALTKRTFDKEKIIRSTAILSLNKLQDAQEAENVSLKTLKFHLAYDPDFTVRTCALKTIEVTSNSLNNIFEAIFDPVLSVQRTAFTKLADQTEIVHFNLNDRYKILKNGYYNHQSVREVLFKSLLPNWIKSLDKASVPPTDSDSSQVPQILLVKFLSLMDIRRDLKFCQELLTAYLISLTKTFDKDVSRFIKLVFEFKEKYLDDYKLFTKTSLTVENTFLWRILCSICIERNLTYKPETTQNDDSEEPETEVVDLLDELIPDIPVYCNFLQCFVNKLLSDYPMGPENDAEKDDRNFIFIQILKIGNLYSINDTAQWSLMKNIMSFIVLSDKLFVMFSDYIEEAIFIFSNYFKSDDEKFLELIYEFINTLNQPDGTESQKQVALSQTNEQPSLLVSDCDSATVKTTQIERMVNGRESLTQDSQSALKDRMDKDPQVLKQCLTLCYSFLHVGHPKKNIPLLPSLFNRLVLPNLVYKQDPEIRKLAVKAFGAYCFACADTINHFLKVFIEIIEEESYAFARVEALKFLFDFYAYHGPKKINFMPHDFKDTNHSRNGKTENTMDVTEMSDRSFHEYFADLKSHFLNEPQTSYEKIKNSKAKVPLQAQVEYYLFDVCVRGLCKLLYLGRLYSVDFIAKLIIILANYKNMDPSLRQYMRGFFYYYVQDNWVKYIKSIFTNVTHPLVDAYEPMFLQLLDAYNTENEMHISEKVTHFEEAQLVLECYVPPEMRNELAQRVANTFDIIGSEKSIITLNIKFINKIIVFNRMSNETRKELKGRLDRFRKRLYDKNNIQLDEKNQALLEKLIARFKTESRASNNVIDQEQEEENDEDNSGDIE